MPLPRPGKEIEPESDDPVHSCQSLQQPEGKRRQFAMAGGPSGRREAKKVLKTSQAVLINEGLVCSSPRMNLSFKTCLFALALLQLDEKIFLWEMLASFFMGSSPKRGVKLSQT